jgi:hypothetical protein
MRSVVALVVLSIAVSGSGPALAQSERAAGQRADVAGQQEAPEEVVVRGRRIGELRAEIEDARQRAYGIFNEINSNDEFDVRCRKDSRAGTNVPTQVCRAQFEERISSAAGQEYLSGLFRACRGGGGVTQDCMFSNAAAAAISAAQGVEGQAPSKRDQLKDEILRLANEDERFAQAIIDWYEANQQYEAARKRRDD